MVFKILAALLLLAGFFLAFLSLFAPGLVGTIQYYGIVSIACFAAAAALGVWHFVGLFERYMYRQREKDLMEAAREGRPAPLP